MNPNTLYIWSDGSANVKTKQGGIGIYMRYKDSEKSIRAGFENTKTGRMEIKAVIIALNNVQNKAIQIHLYSDSMYVINSINLWMESYKQRGWLGVANEDLWKQFLEIYSKFNPSKFTISHVKGHTLKLDDISIGNAIVDELACYKTQEKIYSSDLELF